MPLISAKPKLQLELQQLLYKSMYETLISLQNPSDVDASIVSKSDNNNKKFATQLATKFSQEAAGPMANAIHSFVSQMSITMIPSGALISTSITTPSPVIGTCPPTDFTIT